MVARLDSTQKWITHRQLSKFECLVARSLSLTSKRVNPRAVLNLSSKQLDAAMTFVLSKGLNFVVALLLLPIKEVVCRMELAVCDRLASEDEEVRGRTCTILKSALPPKNNVTKLQWRALDHSCP